MASYTQVKVYKRGVKRANGKGCECILSHCHNTAMVSAISVREGGKRMPLTLCMEHAVEHGVIEEST